MKVAYNEIDDFCCDWMSNLMDAGAITPGVIMNCSIEDIRPADLIGFDRVHFFAGIGVWEYAFIQSGLADYSGVWTGSCPCQPFSAAGKGGGFDDERHLWPAFFHLVKECRPSAVLGEQVASKDGLAWLDLVQDDMEATDYAFGAGDLCAAGFGAPHIRQRLYWAAFGLGDSERTRLEGHGGYGYSPSGWAVPHRPVAPAGAVGLLADDTSLGREVAVFDDGRGSAPTSERQADERGSNRASSLLADHNNNGLDSAPRPRSHGEEYDVESHSSLVALSDTPDGPGQREIARATQRIVPEGDGALRAGTGPTNGFWRLADWLQCRDGKWRPVEPESFPLAHGASARVGRLRAYGNAIVAPQAIEFCGVVREFVETINSGI